MSYAVPQTSSCLMYMSSCQKTNTIAEKVASLLCIWEVPNSDASPNSSYPQQHSSWPSSLYRQMPGQFVTIMLQVLPSTFVPFQSYLASYQSNKPQITGPKQWIHMTDRSDSWLIWLYYTCKPVPRIHWIDQIDGCKKHFQINGTKSNHNAKPWLSISCEN
jgi:hypothetical protein